MAPENSIFSLIGRRLLITRHNSGLSFKCLNPSIKADPVVLFGQPKHLEVLESGIQSPLAQMRGRIMAASRDRLVMDKPTSPDGPRFHLVLLSE